MLHEATEDLPDGIYARNHRELITDLPFADDCALLAHTEEALQHFVNPFSDAAKNLGLAISLKKTEVLVHPLHGKRAVLLASASMAPTQTQWNISLTWVASSPMMPQSARIFTTACPKPAVHLDEC